MNEGQLENTLVTEYTVINEQSPMTHYKCCTQCTVTLNMT